MKFFFSNSIFDPKNPIWLKILRYLVIFTPMVVFFGGFIASFVFANVYVEYYFDYLDGYEFQPGLFLFYLLIDVIVSASLFVSGMITLGALTNLQEIRINTSK
jgi:hypothetical protein